MKIPTPLIGKGSKLPFFRIGQLLNRRHILDHKHVCLFETNKEQRWNGIDSLCPEKHSDNF